MSSVTDIKEVKSIIGSLKKTHCGLPDKDKNILEWSAAELKAHVLKETKGKSIGWKLKFARTLDKRIKDARKESRN